MQQAVRIAIVEDDAEFQQALLRLVQDMPGLECVAVCGTCEEALEVIPEKQPDIVLMDMRFPENCMDGISCIARLRLCDLRARFMVISSTSDDRTVFDALRMGAGSYILKGDVSRSLSMLLYEFIHGGAPMSPEIASKVIQSFQHSADDLHYLQLLTPREKEILDLLSRGFDNGEVAQRLGISPATVKRHIHNIYGKLEVRHKVDALRKYKGSNGHS